MARDLIIKPKRIGDPSSEYGYDVGGKQFEENIKRHVEENETLYRDFVEFMKCKNVDPRKFRGLFMRYYKEFIGG
jgi:hypothetical protein